MGRPVSYTHLGGNLFLTGKPIGFFQIQEQIVHIRVRDGGADAVVADGLYNCLLYTSRCV